jgi:hypothetical protein
MTRHIERQRLRLPTYAGDLSPTDVISAVGGLPAFPTYHLTAELFVARATLPVTVLGNDLVDADILRYHPYSAVSVVDNDTHALAQRGRVPGRERICQSLESAVDLLKKVEDGALPYFPSYVARTTPV